MSTAATAESPLQHYARQGYAVFPDVLDVELIDEVAAHVDWLTARNPGRRPETLGVDLLADDPFWVRLVGDDRLLDVAAQFIGDGIALFASQYVCKPPGDGQPVLWHQDAAYWPQLEPMEVVSLWLAVDDSLPENGCLRVIPGSHDWPVHERREVTAIENLLSSEIALDVDESAAVDVVVPRGGVSVHHPSIVHGSRANRSTRRRCGLTIRYIPTTTRIRGEQPWPICYLLRGDGTPHRNVYATPPRFRSGDHMPFRGCR
ncbi:MAG TPA: phytanoyl-CoA dioxygenase family protein [Candidatus Dormibacteraeota bacterium]|nr:phytanoyl-CoA dioxygenase family protein [Candidatus Dormibacteraeota bacterium]